MNQKPSIGVKGYLIAVGFIAVIAMMAAYAVLTVGKVSRNEYLDMSKKQMITAAYSIQVFNQQIDKDIQMLANNPLLKESYGRLTRYQEVQRLSPMTPSKNGGVEQQIYEVFEVYGTTHPGTLYVYLATMDGGYVEWPETDVVPNYDPTDRPWYQEGIRGIDRVVRTKPYRHLRTGNLMTSNLKALQGPDGETIGVVGIDVEPPFLDEMLKKAQNDDAFYMVVHPDGIIMADGSNSANTSRDIREIGIDGIEQLLVREEKSFYVSIQGMRHLVNSYYAEDASVIMASIIPDKVFRASIYRLMGIVALFSGVVIAFVMVLMSQYLKARNESVKSLYFDSRTGFYSRNAIFDLLENMIDKAGDGVIIGSLIIKISNLKLINDTFGYETGDAVAQHLAERLRMNRWGEIHFGRISYSEFLAVIVSHQEQDGIVMIAESLLSMFNDNMTIDGKTIFVSGHGGVAEYPEHGNDVVTILRCAHAALDKSLEKGQSHLVAYNESFSNEMEERITFQRAVRSAINNDELYLVYQPIISLIDESIVSFEALVRWNSRNYGFVNPERLIQTIESMGLIVPVGYGLFRQACVFSKELTKHAGRPIVMSVNISALQLLTPGFSQGLLEITEEVGIPSSQIYLELTETVLMSSIEEGMSVLEELRASGFGIALDDFGVGYSSLGYFNTFVIDSLKIDKSFVWKLEAESYSKNLVSMLITLSHQIGVKVVAEGVETTAQSQVLKEMGCDCMQGYLFSKPLGESDAIRMVGDYNWARETP